LNDAVTLTDFSGRGGEFFEGEPTREYAVKREASWGIATSRDWGRAIDVGEAAAGGERRRGRVAESARWDELYIYLCKLKITLSVKYTLFSTCATYYIPITICIKL
jgi:hypothetical protein